MSCDQAFYWRVTVSSGGVTYDLSRDLSSVTVEEEDRAPTMLTIQLSDPFTVFSHALRKGVDAEVELGTGDDHGIVFRGRIYHSDTSLQQDGSPGLTVKAYDAAMKMGVRRRSRRFRDMKLSEIVKKVAQSYFPGSEITPQPEGDPTYNGQGLRQREETDLCFLRRLAAEAECAMGVELRGGNDAFVFAAPSQLITQAADVTLYAGRCDVPARLLTFDAHDDVGDMAVPRAIAGIHPESGVPVDVHVEAATDIPPPEDVLRDENVAEFTKSYADRGPALGAMIAVAEKLDASVRASLGPWRREAVATFATLEQVTQQAKVWRGATVHGMQASGTTVGNRKLHARAPLEIVGTGYYAGTWYVSKATHRLDREGYRTEFTCSR